MGPWRATRAAVLAVALTLALSSAAAAGPSAGLHYQMVSASANLTQGGLWDCPEGQDAAGATIALGFVVGRNFTATGGPNAWRDVDFHFQIFPCEGEVGYDLEGVSLDLSEAVPAEQMWVAPLASAALDDVTAPAYREVVHEDGSEEYEPTGVTVTYDLTWAVPPTATITGSAQQRVAEAVVSGTVLVSGLPDARPDVTFVVGNDHNAALASSIVVSASRPRRVASA